MRADAADRAAARVRPIAFSTSYSFRSAVWRVRRLLSDRWMRGSSSTTSGPLTLRPAGSSTVTAYLPGRTVGPAGSVAVAGAAASAATIGGSILKSHFARLTPRDAGPAIVRTVAPDASLMTILTPRAPLPEPSRK